MARCRVWILSDNEEPGIRHWVGEGAQDVRSCRKVAAAGSHLSTQEVAHSRHIGGNRLKCLGPLGVDKLPKWPGRVHPESLAMRQAHRRLSLGWLSERSEARPELVLRLSLPLSA